MATRASRSATVGSSNTGVPSGRRVVSRPSAATRWTSVGPVCRSAAAALVDERHPHDVPAAVDLADAERVGHAHVAVEGRVGALAAERVHRLDLDAGRVERHEEHREALVLRDLGVRCGSAGTRGCETCAVLVNIFWPLITHSSPSRTAVRLGGGRRRSRSRARCSRATMRISPRSTAADELAASAPRCRRAAIVWQHHVGRGPAVHVQADAGDLLEDGLGQLGVVVGAAVLVGPAGAEPAVVAPGRRCSSHVWYVAGAVLLLGPLRARRWSSTHACVGLAVRRPARR